MAGDKKDFFLIDGYALIYRSYFAFIKNPLRTRTGENTGAVYGFTSFLLRIFEQYLPSYLVVALDTREPTFRHRLFSEYKATREKMPEELQDQIPRIREVLSALRIPVLEMEGYEADDIIGTLARQAAAEGLRAVIVSGDKDFCQLVEDDVLLLNPGNRNTADEWVGRERVKEKLGVPPDKVVDLLALMGDSSDNVPGVPGVGRKTAEKLIRQFGGLEEIYESIESVSSKKMAEKLDANHEKALLSRDLVTLENDIPLDIAVEDFSRREPDEDAVEKVFRELEFYGFLKERKRDGKVGSDGNYSLITTSKELESFLENARESGRICIDVETTSADSMEAKLVGISMAVSEGEAAYLPIAHAGRESLDLEEVLDILRPVLESAEIEKIGQNLKYDFTVLKRTGLELEGLSFDTMIASYLLEPDRTGHGLEHLAREFLGLEMKSFSDVVDVRNETFADVAVGEAMAYSCEDADYTLRLANIFKGMLEEKRLYSLFEDIELPLVEVLSAMETAGVAIDREFFDRLSQRMDVDLGRLENSIYAAAGEKFNINSHRQLSRILFEVLKLPTQRKTKTGFSTDSEVLGRLEDQHDIARLLLDFRELSKLKNTYVDALPRQINPRTGRIHTSYNQVVTSTGRLSSSGPNLQNIPVRTSIGRELRKGFVPGGEEYLLLSCDYSQIELRIMAHLSGDEEMVKAFHAGEDIHRQTAALVFGIPYEKVPAMLRSRAKEVNFGIIYGMGAFGLARRLNMSIEEAGAFIEGYFHRFSGVRDYIDAMIVDAREQGYVSTIMGRRRYLPDIEDKRRGVREFAQRTAINSPIQGSAADIIKIAMIDIYHELAGRKLKSRMIIQVHDELVFEVHRDELDEVREVAAEKMENAIKLKVPVVVDIAVGSNWLECKSGT